MKKTIIKIEYNWCIEGWETAEVGVKGVTYIQEHEAKGDGDKWFYDIINEDSSIVRVFNPNKVFFSPNN